MREVYAVKLVPNGERNRWEDHRVTVSSKWETFSIVGLRFPFDANRDGVNVGFKSPTSALLCRINKQSRKQ